MTNSTEKTQEWLEQNQYSRKSILRYERVFGETWVSTGGEKTTREFCEKYLHLKPGQKVLDLGCGTGGSAFFMADKYGVEVFGVDLSSHMIAIAEEYKQKMPQNVKGKVSFEIADITKREFEKSAYDVIYTRDTVLHIPDKEALYSKLKDYLKPGGILFITDYCRGNQEHSAEFKEYVKKRDYDLRTVEGYGQVLKGAGYTNVQAVDMTKPFIEILQGELDQFVPKKDQFLKDFSTTDFTEIEEGWKAKLVRCRAGDQAWGLFVANKPKV